MKRIAAIAMCGFAAVGLAGTVNAADVLDYDVNNLKAVATDAGGGFSGFSDTFSGTLTLSEVAGTSEVDAFDIIRGASWDQSTGTATGGTTTSQDIGTWALVDFDVTMTFVGGALTAGTIDFEISHGFGANDTYSADLFDLTGRAAIVDLGGGTFNIKVGTENGTFSDSDFGGVDISDWTGSNGELFGSVLEFQFVPGSDGIDENADIELLVVIPAPHAALWGLAGLGGMAFFRRRRTA